MADDTPSPNQLTDIDKRLWRAIWKIQALPRHKQLLWRIKKDCLPVRATLLRRGMNIDPICPRCMAEEESIEHAFFTCTWAQEFWIASPIGNSFGSLSTAQTQPWINRALSLLNPKEKSLFASLAYILWKSRNILIFENKNSPIWKVIQSGVTQAKNLSKAMSKVDQANPGRGRQ
ncbi:Reverse transcriptase zinc-binding domain [Sesbania bispinosa]|nr:Reverse transcriptase zinc-binding domain [Sesbania bispinosa]